MVLIPKLSALNPSIAASCIARMSRLDRFCYKQVRIGHLKYKIGQKANFCHGRCRSRRPEPAMRAGLLLAWPVAKASAGSCPALRPRSDAP
jgi:hypothetical protein